ncbi:MAG: CdaR family protein [Verrucomicrobiota bacterium]|jgi:YbbR domain-containing protein
MITFLRNLIVKDLGLKVFSLVLAILIYCTISFAIRNEVPSLPSLGMASDVRRFHNLPVLVVSSAADVRRFKVTPETVAVTVQGDPQVLAGLESSEIRALVDLTGIAPASHLRKRIEVSTPAGVTHLRVLPTEVQVIFPPDH